MFSKSKQAPIRSLVAEGCRVQGNITFTDGIRIDGTVEGSLTGESAGSKKGTLVFVAEHGRIAGGIKADVIIVNGLVEGPVHATQMLELQPKARISGDISYRQLEMHQGALISGRMHPILPPQEHTKAALQANVTERGKLTGPSDDTKNAAVPRALGRDNSTNIEANPSNEPDAKTS